MDEFKNRVEKFGEKTREIAQKDIRTFATYADVEEALRMIRAEKG